MGCLEWKIRQPWEELVMPVVLRAVFSALLGLGLVAPAAWAAPTASPPRWQAVQPPAKNPVLILPGFLMPEITYEPLKAALLREGHPEVTILQGWPWFASIPTYAAQAHREASAALARTGARRIELVCHSMGGLVGRYLIQRLGYADRVAHYVCFGTPHQGTLLGRVGGWCARSAEQMRPGSRFLKRLNAGQARPPGVTYVAMQAAIDEIVWPQTSALLAGARNTEIPSTFHIGGVLSPSYIRAVVQALEE